MLSLFHDAPLVPGLMVIGGLLACLYVAVQFVLVVMAARWPAVDGEIVGAELIRHGPTARDLQPRITYRYHVEGRLFVNDRIRIGPQPQRVSIIPARDVPLATQSVAGIYRPGRQVRVRYNPRRPDVSVLYAQPNLAVVLLFLVALVDLWFGSRGLRLR